MINESKTNGYITIGVNGQKKKAHFGMNFLKNLLDQGHTIESIGKEMESDQEILRYLGLAAVMYAAFKAYDDQKGLDVDYNEETCVEWTMQMTEIDKDEFLSVMSYALTLNQVIEEGKKRREKSPQE